MYRYTCPFVTTACILRPYIYILMVGLLSPSCRFTCTAPTYSIRSGSSRDVVFKVGFIGLYTKDWEFRYSIDIKPFHSLWISRKRFIRLAIVKSTRNKYPRVRVERHCENFVSGRWCPLRVFNIIVLFIPSTLHSSSCGLCNIWAISCPDWTPCRRYTHIIVLENQLPNQLEIYKKETITPYIYWIRLAVLKREIKSPSSFVYAQG